MNTDVNTDVNTDFYGRAAQAEALVSADLALRSLQRTVDALTLAARPDDRFDALCREINIAETVLDLRGGKVLGAAREASKELEKLRAIPSGNGVRIPWQAFPVRAQTVGGLAGALVPTYNAPTAAQALLPMMVLGKLGCTGVAAPGAANLNWPRVTTSATVAWQSTETTSITESDQGFGQLSLSPHTVGGYTEMSRLLLLQSMPNAGSVVAENLLQIVASTIDQVPFLASGGVAGIPKPLTSFPGVNAVSGAAYTLGTGMTAVTDTGNALLDSARPGWAANRAVASLLRQRQEFSNSTLTLWRGSLTAGQLHDFPAFSTNGVPGGVAVFGNWAYLILCDFSGGLDLEINPVANFPEGMIGMRAFATIDVAPIWPSAFTVVSSIT